MSALKLWKLLVNFIVSFKLKDFERDSFFILVFRKRSENDVRLQTTSDEKEISTENRNVIEVTKEVKIF